MADTLQIVVQAEDRASGVIGKITSGLGGMAQVAGGILGAQLFGKLAGGIASAVQSGQEFGAVVNRIQAVSGAGADAVQQITDKALQLGKDLPLSAKDAADGMYALATAGFSVNETLAASEGVARLASSQMMGVGQASEIVAATLRGFGMEAGEAGKAVDILSQIASTSAAEVSDLGETIKYVGPVAGATGQSLQNMGVAIGLMANQGIKGSMAGTALRGILTRLVAPPKDAAAAMRAMGITVTDGTGRAAKSVKELDAELSNFKKTATAAGEQRALQNALLALNMGLPMTKKGAFDTATAMGRLKAALADSAVSAEKKEKALAALGIEYTKESGKMLSFVEIAKQFRQQMGGMTEAQKTATAAAIAGQEGMSGFLAIVNASDDDFNKMVSSMQNAEGATQKFSDAMNKGLGFEMQQLQGSLETLGIKGFLALEPYMVQAAQAGTKFANTLIDKFDELQKAWAATEGQDAGGRVAGTLSALGLDEGTAAKVGQTVDGVIASLTEGKRRLGEAVAGFQAGQAAGPGVQTANVLSALGIPDDLAGQIGSKVADAVKALEEGKRRFGEALAGFQAGGAAGPGVQTINFLTALGLPEDPAVKIGVFVADTERALTDAKTRLQAAVAAFREGQGAQGVLVGLGFSEETVAAILGFAGRVQQILGAVGAQIAGTWDSMARAAAPLVPVFQELLVALTPVGQFLGGVLLGAIGLVTGAIPGLINIITGLVTALTGGVQIMTGVVGLLVNTVVKLLMGDFAGAWQQAQTSVQNIMSGIGNILLGGIEIIAGILRTLIGAVVGAFTTLYDAVVGHSIVPDMVNAIVDWFAQLPGRVGEWVRQVVSDTVAKFGELAGQAVRLGSDIVGGVVQGVKDAGGRLFDSLRNLAGNALDAAKGALGIKSPSTVFAAEVGIPIVQGITQGILAGERGLSDAVVTILRSMSRLAMEVDLADILGKNDLARLDALADGLGRVANVTKSLQDIMSGGVSLRDFIQEQLALDLPALDLGAARAWADRLSEWATAISNVVTSRTAGIPDAAQAITERAASVIGQVRDSIRASFDLARFMEEAQGGRPLRMDAEAASRLASSLGAYASGVVNAYAASLGALPRGQSLTPALAGAGGASGGTLSSAAEGGITVHINIDKLDSSIDLEVLANRVATVIAARMR